MWLSVNNDAFDEEGEANSKYINLDFIESISKFDRSLEYKLPFGIEFISVRSENGAYHTYYATAKERDDAFFALKD